MQVDSTKKGYRVPQHNVLLISCMDLRLIDNIVKFMDGDNLTNRYDQFILAGASIGVFADELIKPDSKRNDKFLTWKKSLEDHIDLAVELHEIHDIYILEHRGCGAYKKFLGHNGYEPTTAGDAAEYKDHKFFSDKLMQYLLGYLKDKHGSNSDIHFNVHSFLMDLRGNVELIDSTVSI